MKALQSKLPLGFVTVACFAMGVAGMIGTPAAERPATVRDVLLLLGFVGTVLGESQLAVLAQAAEMRRRIDAAGAGRSVGGDRPESRGGRQP